MADEDETLDQNTAAEPESSAEEVAADSVADDAAGTEEENNGSDGASSTEEAKAKPYDFAHPSHKLNSRLPVLELINERLAENFAANLSSQFHQNVSVRVSTPTFEKFQDYASNLPACINIDQFKMDPLRGSALMILDGDLVFKLVDLFFGGNTTEHESSEARKFTPTEQRVISRIRSNLFASMQTAWDSIIKIDPKYQSVLTRAQITSPANPAAVVVYTKFEIEIKSGKGECHVVMPYSMLEPIRAQLTNNIEKNTEQSQQWRADFATRVMESEVDIKGVFAESQISVKQLLELKVGDFIPLGNVRNVVFTANNTPLFEATVGVSNGLVSASVTQWHQHKKSSQLKR